MLRTQIRFCYVLTLCHRKTVQRSSLNPSTHQKENNTQIFPSKLSESGQQKRITLRQHLGIRII